MDCPSKIEKFVLTSSHEMTNSSHLFSTENIPFHYHELYSSIEMGINLVQSIER